MPKRTSAIAAPPTDPGWYACDHRGRARPRLRAPAGAGSRAGPRRRVPRSRTRRRAAVAARRRARGSCGRGSRRRRRRPPGRSCRRGRGSRRRSPCAASTASANPVGRRIVDVAALREHDLGACRRPWPRWRRAQSGCPSRPLRLAASRASEGRVAMRRTKPKSSPVPRGFLAGVARRRASSCRFGLRPSAFVVGLAAEDGAGRPMSPLAASRCTCAAE